MIRLAVSVGDPTSIGPEVCVRALKRFLQEASGVEISLYGNLDTLSSADHQYLKSTKQIRIFATPSSKPLQIARPSEHSGFVALEGLQKAALACVSKEAAALVTGPVDKSWCAKAIPSFGHTAFTGQTEFLRDLTKSKSVTMLLASQSLRVALVTTHVAIKDVANKISKEKITQAASSLDDYLKSLFPKPKIAICALNPHASDNGLFGTEEAEIISPAIEDLQRAGIDAVGPVPADTAFCPPVSYDGFVCMYHDQGLIPLKMSGFFEAINISLGLPFLRTSVDHGTAFDLAGTGKASELSFLNALREAARWAKKKGHG